MGATAPQARHGAALHQRALLPLRCEQPLGQRKEKNQKNNWTDHRENNSRWGVHTLQAAGCKAKRDSEKPAAISG